MRVILEKYYGGSPQMAPFFWPHLQHVEVPQPGMELALQLRQACTTAAAKPDPETAVPQGNNSAFSYF